MKILLISNMYPSASHPFYGIFVKNFENSIVSNGGEVIKIIIEGRAKNRLKRLLDYIYFFTKVLVTILRNEYDLIYVHFMGHSLLPLVPIRMFIRKPLVINAHGSDVVGTSIVNKLIQNLVSVVVRKADLIVVPSHYFVNLVAKKFSIAKQNIFVSPSGGIDTLLFRPTDNAAKENTLFTIGFVSRIDDGKGWNTLLLSAKELKNRAVIPFQIIMIGSGAQENDLKTMIAELELHNEVEYLGPIPHHDLPAFFAQFNLFVFPTRLSESLGLVGLEAMACGTPVIGSNIGGLKGYIKSGYNGELFEPGNYQELAQKIERFMILDHAEQKLYAKNAIATAKNYDSELTNAILQEKLSNLIKGVQ